jgi:AAA15 family ATPase/GTPase
MFKKIKIENFRGIPYLELNDLRQFNLFVGKNNCGKSSILESIFLLCGPTNPKLPININILRGIRSVNDYPWPIFFYNLGFQTPVRLYGEMTQSKEKRTLSIEPLQEETISTPTDSPVLSIKESQTIPSFKINGLALKCSIKKNADKKARIFEAKVNIGKEGMLESSPPKNFPYIIPGQFISSQVYDIQIAKHYSEVQVKKEEKNILDILRKVEPRLVDLTVGAGDILYCDIGLKQRLPLNVMGEGIKKILAIILSIYTMSGGVVLIDEIENGLHYSNQEILWEAVFEAATTFNVQVFAATHSYENIKAFSAAYEKLNHQDDKIRLFRIENEKDNLRAIDFNHQMIDMEIEKDWEVR